MPVMSGTAVVTAYPSGYNVNVVTWSAVTNALRYGVFSSPAPGGVYTLLAPAGTATSYTDSTATVGATMYYKVTSYFAAAATPATTSTANPVTQFPGVPVTAAFRAGAGGAESGNPADGTNHVAWSSSAGSTSYQLYASQGAGDAPVTTTTAMSYDAVGVLRGSRVDYYAVGVNACHSNVGDPLVGVPCLSANAPAGTTRAGGVVPVSVYQRPVQPPTPSVQVAPTLTTNYVRLVFAGNGDAGSPASGKFCGTPGLCDYSLARRVELGAWTSTPVTAWYGSGQYTLDPAYSDANNSGYWGRTFDWEVRTWNPGGWSDPAPRATTLTYPAPFWPTWAGLSEPGYSFSTNLGLGAARQPQQTLTWSQSDGAGKGYWYRSNPTSSWVPTGAALTTGSSRAAAGTVYQYAVLARSNAALDRVVNYSIQQAPGTVSSIQARWQCLESAGQWRVYYDSVDSRPVAGLAADSSRYFTTTNGSFGASGGPNNSKTDGTPRVMPVSAPAWSANSVVGGYYSAGMPNVVGWGSYTTFDNILNTRAGVGTAKNYSVALSLGTTRYNSAKFTGCSGTSSAWKFVAATRENYDRLAVPRILRAYAP